MPPILGLGLGLLAGVFAGATGWVLFAYAAIGLVSSIVSLYQPGTDIPEFPDPTRTIRAPVAPARWILGEQRVGGALVFLREDSGGDVLSMAMVLSEGACHSLAGLWVDGEQVSITRTARTGSGQSGYLVEPVSTSDYSGKIEVYEYFGGDGTQGDSLLGTDWGSADKLNGVSWVHVRLTQPDYGDDAEKRFWTHQPRIDFGVKGIKITWPGQTTAIWTDSAAAIRYWWLRQRRGIPAGAIDNASVIAAHTLCSQTVTVTLPDGYSDYSASSRRYTINGVVESGQDPERVEAEMDFAWQGYAVEIDGTFYFRPGTDRLTSMTLGSDDIVEMGAIQPAPAIQDRVNAVTMRLQQSREHEWGNLVLPEYRDTAAITRDGERLFKDLGVRRFVIDPIAGARLLAIFMRRTRAAAVYTYTVRPGDGFAWLEVAPGDLIAVNDTENGITLQTAMVTSMRVGEDWEVTLTLQEHPSGIYADTLVLPPLKPPTVIVSRPHQVTATVDGLTGTPTAVVREDGSLVVALAIEWTAQAASRIEVRYRKSGTTAWSLVSSTGSSITIGELTGGGTVYEYQARVVSPNGVAGDWAPATPATASITGDTTPPGQVTAPSFEVVRGQYTILWTLPADTDLDVVEVWEGGVYSAAVVANTATVEHVYRATAANAAPATPTGGATTDDYVPADWSAAAIEPTAALPYIWRSTRTQTGGAWTADDFAAPELFAFLGLAALANTATVEFVHRATASNVAPATPTGGATTDDYVPADWSAAAIEPTAALPYVWRSTRTQTGGAWTADDFAAPDLGAFVRASVLSTFADARLVGEVRATAYVRTKVEVETSFRVWLRTRDRSGNTGTELFVGSVTVPGLQRGDWYAATTGTAWSDTEADAATPGVNVVGDAVTLYNNSSGYSETRSWSGSQWTAVDRRIDGNLLVTDSVTSPAIHVDTLNALMGRIQEYLQIGAATGFTAGGPTYTDNDGNKFRAYMDRNEIRLQRYVNGLWREVISLRYIASDNRGGEIFLQSADALRRTLVSGKRGVYFYERSSASGLYGGPKAYMTQDQGYLRFGGKGLIPNQHNADDLGTPSRSWRHLYVDGNIGQASGPARYVEKAHVKEIDSYTAPLKLNRGIRPTASMHSTTNQTYDAMFDFFSPAVPNTNDEVLVTGMISSGTADLATVSRAKRTAGNLVTLYATGLQLGPWGINTVGIRAYVFQNGRTATTGRRRNSLAW